jgi:lipopolysaccharide export system protein LptA
MKSVLALMVLTMAAVQSVLAQIPENVRAKGIDLPYFNGTNLQAYFSADTAELMPGGKILAGNFEMISYGKEGTNDIQMIVRSPKCIFDSAQRQAWSTGRLEVVMAGTNYVLEGDGFFCRQSKSNALLVVSNNVHTIVARPAATNAVKGPSLDIVADQFKVDQQTADNEDKFKAIYTGNVRVQDPDFTSTCGRLLIDMPHGTNKIERIIAEQDVVIVQRTNQGRLTAERAIYSNKDGQELITLSGNPSWRDAQTEGRAELFIIDRTNQTLIARGKAYVKVPNTAVGSLSIIGPETNKVSPGTNQFIEVSAENLKVEMPTKTRPVQSIFADTNVRIVTSDGGVAKADQVRFEGDRGLLTLIGNASYKGPQLEARGETLTLDRTNRTFKARTGAMLRMLIPSSKEAPTKTNQWMEIVCDSFDANTNGAQFRQKVQASLIDGDAPAHLYCETLDIGLQSGQLATVLARGRVYFDQPPSPTAAITNAVRKTLMCEQFTLNRAPLTGRIRELTAENDVIMTEESQGGAGYTNMLAAESVNVSYFENTNAVKTMVAEKNVRLSHGRNLATGQRAVYNAEQDIFELTGNPTAIVDRPGGEPLSITESTMITYHPKTGKVGLKGFNTSLPLGTSPVKKDGPRPK